MTSNFFAILLAGGSGTRLWPLSRKLLPKHLLTLQGNRSLLQETAARLLKKIDPEQMITVTHEDHRYEVKQHLQSVHPALAEHLIAEPEAKNTLPAISLAVAKIAKTSPQAVIGVFPSDHLIRNEVKFLSSLDLAVQLARDDFFVTFGVRPAAAETGYGYLEVKETLPDGAFSIRSFTEKPNLETAQDYLKKGNYYWNSGMFCFQASVFLKALQKFEPDIFESVSKINAQFSLLPSEYSKMKSISIDYGIMEKADNVAMVPIDCGWTDLGSWESFYQEREKDKDQNVIEGNVLQQDSHSSLLISKDRFLATIGLQKIAVIQTDDAVLVSPLNRVQEVKSIVEKLKTQKSTLVTTHTTAIRPWGQYTVLEERPEYKVKRIIVQPGQKLSLQRHQHRSEHWVVIEGTARITDGTREKILHRNESAFIPQGEKHRLENAGGEPLIIIEVQTGSYVGEDDIERFYDDYGRTP